MFRSKHLEIIFVIPCIFCRWEVAVVRAFDKHFQPCKDMVLSGVNAKGEQFALDAVILGGVAQVGHIHTAASFDSPDMPFLPFFAESDDLIREVAAAVHADRPQGQLRAVFLFPCAGKELVQVCPHLTAFQVAVDALVPDAPAFSADTPAHHFGLEAVVLRIDTGCQIHHAVRDFGLVEFAAVQ